MHEDRFMFGRRLLPILDERRITQKQLAKAIGCYPKTISGWMNGRSKPGYEFIRSMATFLGVSADYLLGLDGTQPWPPQGYVSREEITEWLEARREAR